MRLIDQSSYGYIDSFCNIPPARSLVLKPDHFHHAGRCAWAGPTCFPPTLAARRAGSHALAVECIGAWDVEEGQAQDSFHVIKGQSVVCRKLMA
jgi:hypothetical protein